MSAEGAARISRNVGQRFVVKVAARVKDGTVLIVSATARGETFDVGAIRMLLGSGSLELNSLKDDSSQVFPVLELTGIAVSLRGEVLLEGKFSTLAAGKKIINDPTTVKHLSR